MFMKPFLAVPLLALLALPVFAEEAVPAPAPEQPAPAAEQPAPAPAPEQTVDAVLAELTTIGPDVLLARVEALKADIDRLKNEAAAARQKADELEAQSAAARARVETIEKFVATLQTAMQPAPAPPPEQPAPEAAPAEQPAAPAPEAAPAPSTEPAPAG